MYISLNSFKNFILVNSFLIFLSICQHKSIHHFTNDINNHQIINLFYIFLVFVVRNYTLLYFIDFGTRNKQNISNEISNIPKEDYKYEFHYHIFTTTAVESLTHIFIKINMTNVSQQLYIELLYFIPVSFVFEIVFDLFHYIGHYLLHHKDLYKYLHKKHHKFKHPTSIITFYQEPIDLIITNSIPTILTLYIVPNISYLQFNLIIVYKNFIEISGHVGKKIYPNSCFAQFVWLPKALNIELYTEDHDLHHSLNNCNYAKRFSLWDKLFKTYKSSKT